MTPVLPLVDLPSMSVLPSLPAPPPPPSPPGLLQRLFTALFPGAQEAVQKPDSFWARWVFGRWSLPARVAVSVALVLLAIVVVSWMNQLWNPDHLTWSLAQPAYQQLLVLLLLVVIPVAVYQALRLWFQTETSAFPDIDAAWTAGREELRRQGIDLRDRPLYLVLGSTGESLERGLLEGMGGDRVLQAVPTGPGPLRWYVDSQRIFLCCSGAGWSSAVAHLLALRKRGRGGPRETSPLPELGTPVASRTSATIRPGAFLQSRGGMSPGLLETAGSSPGAVSGQSISLENFMGLPSQGGTGSPQVPGAAAEGFEPWEAEDETPAIVPASDARLQQERLEAVAALLKSSRFPYCPINGCIMLLPFAAAHASEPEIEEISKAVNADLLTAQAGLQVRFPVIALFTGLEREPGFRELMRRVGPERSRGSRFGMGYDLRAPASSPELDGFATHVCGVFEDWVYGLFREDQELKRPGNSPLFALLCRVRSSFKSRLTHILSQGFGYSERLDPQHAPYYFSGCYFVATGDKDERAFAGGILEKMEGEQDRLQWSPAATAEDRRVAWVGRIAALATLIFAVTLAFQLFR